MGSFAASLKSIGDTKGLPATVSVSDGRLSIAAGKHSIGDWALSDIRLEPIPVGFRMTAEGDQLVIELPDADGFSREISRRARRITWPRSNNNKETGTKKKNTVAKKKDTGTDSSEFTAIEQPRVAATTTPVEKAEKDSTPTREVILRPVDAALAAAEDRYGNLLPHWVFTRMMAAIVLVSLLLALIFPAAVSLFLLVSGLLTVVFGAVVYTDPMLMAKWLPGRMQPMHVLMIGVVVLLLGVLLGVIAN